MDRGIEVGDDDARVDRHRRDGGVACGEFARKKDICELRLAVAAGGMHFLQSRLVPDDAARGRRVVAHAGEVDDAHVGVGFLGRFQQRGQQELGQERMPHVVCAELHLVALLGEGVGHEHDTGIVYEDVETFFSRRELLGGFGDRGEGRQVQGEMLDHGIGDGRLDLFNGGRGFGGGARSEVYARGGVCGQVGDGLLAEARVSWVCCQPLPSVLSIAEIL